MATVVISFGYHTSDEVILKFFFVFCSFKMCTLGCIIMIAVVVGGNETENGNTKTNTITIIIILFKKTTPSLRLDRTDRERKAAKSQNVNLLAQHYKDIIANDKKKK